MFLPLYGDRHSEIDGSDPPDVRDPVCHRCHHGEDVCAPPHPQRWEREDGGARDQVQDVEEGQHNLSRGNIHIKIKTVSFWPPFVEVNISHLSS